ncbi:MAG: RNase adapter RapZ [Trueperaceae bacterium]|nr:RNase adapter RapZ [Trueperaceae bacterium]
MSRGEQVTESGAEQEVAARPLVVLTGLSGAGKTSALHALEDLGFYTVDSLPPKLWATFVGTLGGDWKGICISIDIRVRELLADVPDAVAELKERGLTPRLIFLDASDEVLVKRYNFTRRAHPMAAGTLTADLAAERVALQPLRALADDVIDTSNTDVRTLTQLLWDRFSGGVGTLLRLVSFGFKRGIPTDVDVVLDVRGMPNPYYAERLRRLPGTNADVQEYVFTPEALELYHQIRMLVRSLAHLAESSGRNTYTVAVGCTGGQHRSVAVVERLSQDLAGAYRSKPQHRDLAAALEEHGPGNGGAP